MTGMEIDGSQIYSLARSFTQGSVSIGKEAQIVVRKTAIDIESDAKKIAFEKDVHDTGDLIDSIGHSDLRTVGQSGSLEAQIEPTVDYAYYNEVGTSTLPPRPFMGPALDRHADPFEQALAILAERSANGGA
ncbi:hypothetical protein PV761_03250 [Arthrobacter sp. CC3]|uniref:hypothetical protein n=1 Tax=Arthrobacter sp. CC3 TaxID=3029185 RepID=UPI003263D309